MILRSARAGDLPALSALALRSKGHWGYDAHFLEACRAELTITPDRLDAETIVVAEASDGAEGGSAATPVGFFALRVTPPGSEVMDLFVDPPWIGRGVGTLLWSSVVESARRAGARWIDVEADPNAASWYERRGARLIGRAPSGSIGGRTLPVLRVDLGG
jgi:GNAT superfamily N-acetyltransferase